MNLMESANNSCEEDENNKPFLVVTAGQKSDDLVTKFLNANSGEGPNKTCLGWREIHHEFRLSESEFGLVNLAQAAAKRWEGRRIVMLVDEITDLTAVNKLDDQSVPELMNMILVVNPVASRYEPGRGLRHQVGCLMRVELSSSACHTPLFKSLSPRLIAQRLQSQNSREIWHSKESWLSLKGALEVMLKESSRSSLLLDRVRKGLKRH